MSDFDLLVRGREKDIAISEGTIVALGRIAVADGKIEAALALLIAGLASDQPLESVIEKIAALNAAAHSLGCTLPAPFMSLSFLSLSPIPALKLTDQGLVDAVEMKLISLFAD